MRWDSKIEVGRYMLMSGKIEPRELDNSTRALLLLARQVLIMLLGGIEDYLGMQRSIIPKHQLEQMMDAPPNRG
jgi:hypothetical protein